MTPLNFIKQTLTLLTLFVVLMFAVTYNSIAEEKPSTLSGRVINANGEPLADSTVVLMYVKLRKYSGLDPLYDRTLYPFLEQRGSHLPPHLREQMPDEQELREHPPYLNSQTDLEGNFTITGIVSGTVQLRVVPDGIPEKAPPPPQSGQMVALPPEIKAIKFGKALFYPHPFPFSSEVGAVTFAIKPGANIKNVEIIMKSEQKSELEIQGRIVFKNRTPLADTSVKINVALLPAGEIKGESFKQTLHTDADGNFSLTASEPGIYAMSIDHLGLSSASEIFLLKERKHHEGLVLTLNGNSEELDVPPENDGAQPNRFIYEPKLPKVWVVNPENGHAYRAIQCDSREEAQEQAEAEEAHLLTITSEEEQIWLEVVFGGEQSWIGLKYVAFGSKWQWDTGEPLNYTNWKVDTLSDPAFPGPSRGVEKNYAIMKEGGVWKSVDMTGRSEGRIRAAIIEKDGLRAKKPEILE